MSIGSASHRRGLLGAGLVLGVAVSSRWVGRRLGGRMAAGAPIEISRSTTIDRPAQELYDLWRRTETLNRLLPDGQVTATADGHAHCVFRTWSGKRYAWDTVVVEDRPGELVRWGPAPGHGIKADGSIAFRPLEGGAATEVTFRLRIEPPSPWRDPLVLTLPSVFNEDMLGESLRRFGDMATGRPA